MNKKLLFAAMSLAALTACNSDDFENQQIAEQAVSPVQFEVLNSNDAFTRASMGGTNNNTIEWNVTDNDLFTLYHGAPALGAVTGYQNATYKATANDGEPATLTTPSMILEGAAVMVWPVDSEFNIKSTEDLFIKIPANQTAKIQNEIPYVSDQIDIKARTDGKGVYNFAGYERKYPVYMRPMASQLNIVADYAKTDDDLKELETSDGIDPIQVTSVNLINTTHQFTTKIGVKFTDPAVLSIDKDAQWTVANNAWGMVTDFDAVQGQAATLTTKFLNGNDGCKFLILPQTALAEGTDAAAVVVNTTYGKVIVAKKGVADTKYVDGEWEDAWYRYITKVADKDGDEHETTIKNDKGQTKVTAEIAQGLKQTVKFFSEYKNKKEDSPVYKEPQGTAVTRYVKVLLTHLDMDGLHLDTDKKLRDAAIVWMKMGLENATIWLDGTKGKFEISQNTIKTINEINAAAAKEDTPRHLYVTPCNVDGEKCETIVITGSSQEQKIQDLTFIKNNGGNKAYVALADEGEAKPWIWDGTVKVGAADVAGIINMGVMENAETKTLKTAEANGTQNNVEFANNGTWNINAGAIINVQFSVWNLGTVNINGQYRQDGADHTFVNYAETLPGRFLKDPKKEVIGKVNNYGVFATVNNGTIINVGLIEHADKNAKTYITYNQYGTKHAGTVDFAEKFEFNKTESDANMIGRINLPFENKDEDNISVSAALTSGFVSVTIDGEVTGGTLSNNSFGSKVNYVIVKSGINKIAKLDGASSKIKYFEVDMSDKSELEWSVTGGSTFDGLIVLSPVNITLGTTVHVKKACYLGADMYVGGKFDNNTPGTLPSWSGYYGNTTADFATKYITY